MTTAPPPHTESDLRADVRGSRLHVARSRGATSGVLLVIFGAWAALVPFIGPYFDFAFTPSPDEAWHWTTGRGLYEVLPGAAAGFGGLFLLISANRVTASFGGWLAAASGAWLVVGPVVAGSVGVDIGRPDTSMSQSVVELAELLYFFGIGAAIVLVAALALGRLSVHSVRDVRVAHRRAERAAAAEAEQERLAAEQAQREQAQREQAQREQAQREPAATEPRPETGREPRHQAPQQQPPEQQTYGRPSANVPTDRPPSEQPPPAQPPPR